MKRSLSRAWVSFWMVLALAQLACAPSPVLQAVSPETGIAAGGEVIELHGRHLDHVSRIWFGAAEGELLEMGDLDVRGVRTPTGLAGTVPVEVEDAFGHRAVLSDAFTFVATDARFADRSARASNWPLDVRGRSAIAVDLDGDGDPDVLQARRGAPPRVLFNDSGMLIDRTEGCLLPVPLAASADPSLPAPVLEGDTMDVAVGDVNGDGALDLITAEHGTDGAFNRLYLGDGESPPHFQDVTSAFMPATAARTTDVELLDVDGDGDLDLLVADWQSGEEGLAPQGVHLWMNDGVGMFAPAPERLPDAVRDVAVFAVALADFDGDGDVDIFAPVANGVPLLLLNDGAGTFGRSPVAWLPVVTPFAARRPAVGDVDGDGSPDLYLTNADGPDRLWLNDGSGRFADFSLELLPQDPAASRHAALADLDLDGDLDVLVGRLGSAPESLYLNDGSGRMFDYSSRLPGEEVRGGDVFVVTDLDGDGAPDLFLSVDHGRVRLFLQELQEGPTPLLITGFPGGGAL